MRTIPSRNTIGQKLGGRARSGKGLVIAFLGADGAGKSTCVDEIFRWLAVRVPSTREYHGSGDGPSSIIRAPLNGLRRLVLGRGSSTHQSKTGASRQSPARVGIGALLRAVWALVLSAEKRGKLRRTWRSCQRGHIVLCDRYPQARVMGFNDGPLLSDWLDRRVPLGAIARWERVPYERAERHPPDMVVKLRVSPRIALERKPDMSLDEIERRIRAIDSLTYPEGTRIDVIDADQPLETVLRQVKRRIRDRIES